MTGIFPLFFNQLLWNVTQGIPIIARCNLHEFYPAPKAEILVNGAKVTQKDERQFLKDNYCLHSGVIELSPPVLVTNIPVEIQCVVKIGETRRVERTIKLYPPGYDIPEGKRRWLFHRWYDCPDC